ncbi:hypothetical protein [Candidatus Tisiphia endosymbiont of Oplodontha viridula]|uniref:hypothetical protein n=1 Tax=Candidatus Tisiphia endosymbiont of Oplodontha viridula TaxID=3077925 RepID=UPI0035C91E3D
MKWQVIAGISQKINEEAKGYLIRKLEKDASVEMPNLWADFIKDTTNHLHQSQSNIEVASDNKTGGFSCLTQFDELHPDFSENNKPFSDYFLGKYDQRAVDYLQRAKNPLTKRMLQAKINEYKISLAGHISHTEAKLIDGKRHHLAIEAIEKFKIATYDNPEFYSSNLQDSIVAISSLSLLPQEKEQMLINARQSLAFAAALGTLKYSPDAILNPNIKAEWKEDLSLEQRVKLEHQANNLIHHQQLLRQHQLSSLTAAHFAGLLATGKGIDGIENLLQASFNAGDPRLLQFRTQEALYKQAFVISQQIKHLPFNQCQEILQQIAPKGGDSDYLNKERIYHILVEQFNKQLKLAQTDPARLAEENGEIPKDMALFQRYLLRKQLQEQKGIPSYAQRYLMESERTEFLKKIQGKDVNQIKQAIDSIISLRDDDTGGGEQYGLEIMDEILRGKEDLECLTQFYAENRLYNRKTASAFIQMIALVNELSVKSQPLFIGHEMTEFNKEIDKNYIFERWSKDLAKTDIQNETEINQTRQAIKYLAKYYQRTEDLSIAKAVKKATTKLISEVDMRIDSKNLQIPRQVVVQRMIHDLNADNIEASLVEIQLAIINGSIACDYGTIVAESNGRNTTDNINDPTGQYTAAAKVRESLQQGKWQLTSDKKSVYYTFPTKDGRYLPVMAKDGKILKFDLLELNNPKALEQQKQRLLQTISEYPQYD